MSINYDFVNICGGNDYVVPLFSLFISTQFGLKLSGAWASVWASARFSLFDILLIDFENQGYAACVSE